MIDMVLFGVGAAGNKAAIAAIESNVISEDNVHLLNTTLRDIPEKYKIDSNQSIKFGNLLGGCGKEPEKGSSAMIEGISNGSVDLNGLVPEDTKAAVIVTSIEGGTGSGATPIIVKYFDMLNIPCHVFAFIGFQDEARGISNSIKFFKELGETNAILHTINNSSFIDYTSSHSIAESAANQEFCKQLEIMIGSKMIPSEQIIDDTDHYKLITTAGYMDIIHINRKFSDPNEIKRSIDSALTNSPSLPYNAGCKRLAIIVDGNTDMNKSIDECIDTIKQHTGEPFELYRHFQTTGDSYINIIVSGLAYPEQSITAMVDKLNDLMSKINNKSKSLSEILDGVSETGDEFNSDVKQRASANDARAKFAKMFNAEHSSKPQDVSKNTKPKDIPNTTVAINKTSDSYY